jgi:hypothetical protein
VIGDNRGVRKRSAGASHSCEIIAYSTAGARKGRTA